MKISRKQIIYFNFFLLIIIVFFPLLKVGFTTADDAIDHYLNIINPNVNIINIARGIAESQSRYQYFFVYLISLFPYLFIDNFLIFKIISLSQILLNFILFSYLIFKLSKSKIFAFLIFLFLSSFIQNSWQHNLLTSYPFIFSFGMNLSLISLIFFINYLKNKNIWNLIYSVILFFLSLFNYEIFILYILIFILIAFFFIKDKNIFNRLRLVFVKLIYHFLLLFLFLAVYIIYKKIYPGVYDGTQSFNFNIFRIIRTSIQFSISSFPTYIYRHSIGQVLTFSYSFDRALLSFKYVFKNIQLEWLIKGIISFITCFFILLTGSPRPTSGRRCR